MLIDKWTDANNELFVKFFLIDASKNNRDWATTNEANERYARTAIGTPFTLMLNKADSKYLDYHPFLPNADAPIKDQIDFAYKYAIGQIVDVSQDSERYKGAYGGVERVLDDNPWFATVKITDPTIKEEFQKPDSKLIPKAVSPGIIHLAGPDKAITEYQVVHLAAVPEGAYGPRAIKWASCNGDALSCIPKLKGASYKERTNVCPLDCLSSLQQKSASSDITMSAVSNASTPGPMSFGSGTVDTTSSNTNQQQQQNQAPMKPTIRIRRYKAQGESQEENPNGTQQEQPEGNNGEQTDAPTNTADAEMDQAFKSSPYYRELQNLKAQVGKQNEQWAYKEKRYALEKIIPPQLFTDNKGRFRQKDWENEIERAIKENVPMPFLQDYYQTKLMALQVPEIQTKRASTKGASSQNYDDEDNERKMKLAELGKMIRGQR